MISKKARWSVARHLFVNLIAIPVPVLLAVAHMNGGDIPEYMPFVLGGIHGALFAVYAAVRWGDRL